MQIAKLDINSFVIEMITHEPRPLLYTMSGQEANVVCYCKDIGHSLVCLIVRLKATIMSHDRVRGQNYVQ